MVHVKAGLGASPEPPSGLAGKAGGVAWGAPAAGGLGLGWARAGSSFAAVTYGSGLHGFILPLCHPGFSHAGHHLASGRHMDKKANAHGPKPRPNL